MRGRSRANAGMWGARGAISGLMISAIVSSVGCARPDTTKFKELPTYRVDMYASEVTWLREDGEAVKSDKASVQRVEIAEALDALMVDRPDLEKAKPARFAARIVDLEGWGYDVTLRFETGNTKLFGRAREESPTNGVYAALYKGIHPGDAKVPVLNPVYYGPGLKIGFGIPLSIAGTVTTIAGAVFMSQSSQDFYECCGPNGEEYVVAGSPNYETVTTFVLGTHLLAAGVVLLVYGIKKPSPPKTAPKAKSAAMTLHPTLGGLRLEF